MNKITVIGGGAAGLMAAIAAAERGAQVSLIEPNERLGKKVNITGKGRCNVTNDTDLEGLMAHIPRNGRFLYSALSRFTSRDTMAFFEGCGVPLKVERGDRVFPVSDSAFDITDALKGEVKALCIRWIHDRAAAVETAEGHVTAVTGEKGSYPADAVIIATGGVSYPGTGSTGDGYKMAAALGHIEGIDGGGRGSHGQHRDELDIPQAQRGGQCQDRAGEHHQAQSHTHQQLLFVPGDLPRLEGSAQQQQDQRRGGAVHLSGKGHQHLR